MISRNTIDTVFETARVEEVIGDFVQLKKSGSNFKGLSPFTDERTPSFMVSPVKQIWKDFSSGKGGNVVTFLMEHEHFSYPEAIKYLAKKYGIEVEETEQTDEQKQQANERESLYLVSEFARDYFHDTLLNSEEGKAIGGTYFKERGFSEETIKTFQLGYSPNQWEALTNRALEEGYQLEYLEKTGLTIVKEDKKFDRFRGRVIFPISSMSGRTLGFGGRILTSDKKAAKYLNSPESDIYHKSKVLYGIYHAKQSIAKEDNCYLVEGYTDVIQFYQTGIKNVVSSSGTALTPEQIRLISRLTKNITVLFDGDAAGLRASLRGIDLILEQGMNVKICTFPEGEDPDSFAKSNTLEELTLYLEENASDFINFKASLLADQAKNDPIQKAETIRDMVVSVSKIPDVIKREVYIKECARIMDISEEVLFNTLAQILQKDQRDAYQKAKKEPQPMTVADPTVAPASKVDVQYELEREIIELLLNYGALEGEFETVFMEIGENGLGIPKVEMQTKKVCEVIYLNLQEDEIDFANEDFQTLYKLIIADLLQGADVKVDNFMDKIDARQMDLVTDISMKYENYKRANWERKDIYPKSMEDDIPLRVNSNILRLRHLLIQNIINDISQDINTKDEGMRMEMLEIIREYTELKKDITYSLGGVPIPQKRF